MDRLEIQLREYNQVDARTIWQINGLQSQKNWTLAQVGIYTGESYLIFIQATTGLTANGFSGIVFFYRKLKIF